MVILPATLLPLWDWHPLQGHDTETSSSARLTHYLRDWAHGISMHNELRGAVSSICDSWAFLSWLPSLLLPKGQRPDHIVWILGHETDLLSAAEGRPSLFWVWSSCLGSPACEVDLGRCCLLWGLCEFCCENLTHIHVSECHPSFKHQLLHSFASGLFLSLKVY